MERRGLSWDEIRVIAQTCDVGRTDADVAAEMQIEPRDVVRLRNSARAKLQTLGLGHLAPKRRRPVYIQPQSLPIAG